MIIGLALALAAGPLASDQRLEEASNALAAGRPVQARAMISQAVAEGSSGPKLDRLLADLAVAEGRWDEAFVRLSALLTVNPSQDLFEAAGLAALHAGKTRQAAELLDRSLALPGAGWRSWNARAVAADRLGDWAASDKAYRAALELAPDEATSWNNLGWSLMLRGRWSEAIPPLKRAHRLAPANPRIAANLDLARSASDGDLPRRREGESGPSFAARLNDAGVMARLGGNRAKATAAFAQALEASPTWFAPAASNLAALGATTAFQGSERTEASRLPERSVGGTETKRK